MPASRQERLRRYLRLISGDDGLEMARDGLRSGGHEMVAGPQASSERLADAESGLEELLVGRSISEDQLASIEAIVVPALRPVYDIVDGGFSTIAFDGQATPGHGLWAKLSTDATLNQRILDSIPAVGRIEVPGTDFPYGGTGFLVGADLVMTNRHVAAIFAMGLGTRGLGFIPDRGAAIDFKRDAAAGVAFAVRRVRLIHPYWDIAVLEVDGLPAGLQPLRLSVEDAREFADASEVAVIGYPAFDLRNRATVQDVIMRERYQVKRLQPGALHGAGTAESFGKLVPAALHDCSTLGGNSGSVVIALDSGQVVGVHFGGRYLDTNYAVPTGALALDDRVTALGLNFAGNASGQSHDWGDWWRKADSGTEAASRAVADAKPEGEPGSVAGKSAGAAPAVSPVPLIRAVDGSVMFEVPLRITLALGAGVDQALVAAITAGEIARKTPAPGNAVVPKTPADYRNRKGYSPDFLSRGQSLAEVTVPIPEAADPAVLAPLITGGSRLDYQNFSVLMHAGRRLALVTASNVTEEIALREPEAGRDYSRKGLFDEKWFLDPRMEARHQLPEVFFTKDGGAFDKGHIVRRDDVAWGESFEVLLQGNVDSFHVTNCSPQVAGYNRSDSGKDNWGDLENHVLGEAASERLCVFAGPVLSEDDQTFVGQGPGRTVLRARVPLRFWKVIVARLSDGLAAYGFVLEQDLRDVPLEFSVPGEFLAAMYPLPEIASMAGIVFAPSLLAADQFATLRGDEVALRAGATPRRPGTVASSSRQLP